VPLIPCLPGILYDWFCAFTRRKGAEMSLFEIFLSTTTTIRCLHTIKITPQDSSRMFAIAAIAKQLYNLDRIALIARQLFIARAVALQTECVTIFANKRRYFEPCLSGALRIAFNCRLFQTIVSSLQI